MRKITPTLVLAMVFPFFASAQELQPGDPAPQASALNQDGETVQLSDVYAAHEYVVVYFYPKADTPGCTAQACSLRDSYAALTSKGVAVIGVSTDKPAAQKAFQEKYQLPFTLLADTEKEVARAFSVPARIVTARQAFLIHDGKVLWLDRKASTARQAADILNAIKGQS